MSFSLFIDPSLVAELPQGWRFCPQQGCGLMIRFKQQVGGYYPQIALVKNESFFANRFRALGDEGCAAFDQENLSRDSWLQRICIEGATLDIPVKTLQRLERETRLDPHELTLALTVTHNCREVKVYDVDEKNNMVALRITLKNGFVFMGYNIVPTGTMSQYFRRVGE